MTIRDRIRRRRQARARRNADDAFAKLAALADRWADERVEWGAAPRSGAPSIEFRADDGNTSYYMHRPRASGDGITDDTAAIQDGAEIAPGSPGGSVSRLDLDYAKSITGPGGNLAGPGDRGPDPAPITPLRMPEPGKAVVLIVGSHPATAVDVTDDVRALMAGDSWDAVEAAERRLRGLLG